MEQLFKITSLSQLSIKKLPVFKKWELLYKMQNMRIFTTLTVDD